MLQYVFHLWQNLEIFDKFLNCYRLHVSNHDLFFKKDIKNFRNCCHPRSIILSCDIVYASDQAKFGLREIHWGLIPADMMRRGMELMSKRDIAYLSITGDDIDAHEAKAMGWINKVIPHDELMDEVNALSGRLSEGPPVAYDVIKRILNRKCYEDFDSYIETVAALFATEDAAEARKAFLEKRKPVFKGQ